VHLGGRKAGAVPFPQGLHHVVDEALGSRQAEFLGVERFRLFPKDRMT
jgi:hypothetical protein